jgi:hypothetical protein
MQTIKNLPSPPLPNNRASIHVSAGKGKLILYKIASHAEIAHAFVP